MKRKPELLEAVVAPDPSSRARDFAGMLAECGVRELSLEGEFGAVPCRARVTDLPGLLLRHAPCLVRFESSAGERVAYAIDASSIRRVPRGS